MTVAAILEGRKGVPAITVPRGTKVSEAVALLAERKIGAVPVMDGDEVAGIMSERDVIYCLARDAAAMLEWPVEKIMTAPAITVEPTMTVLGALSLMTSRRIRHLPVVEGGRLISVVSIGDLVKHRLDQIEAEAQAMLSYIQTA
jgi:CBS domain-containing protein